MKLFYNVDTQKDFLEPSGSLFVPNSESIRKNLKRLTQWAIINNVKIISSKDWHNSQTEEISETPNPPETFPAHCMEGSEGAEFIEETTHGSVDIQWNKEYSDEELEKFFKVNFTILKDKFDVMIGNPNTEKIFNKIEQDFDEVYIYGVVSEICVKFVVDNFLKKDIKVFLVEDAIKELNKDSYGEALKEWQKNENFNLIKTDEIF